MIYGIFRSRLREESDAYRRTAQRMEALAAQMPGFVSLKTFRAEDGERVSLFEFESFETLEAWRVHAEHREAQRMGQEVFYSEYQLVVGEAARVTVFKDGRRKVVHGDGGT